MAKTYLHQRNQAVKKCFANLCKQNPQWRLDALEHNLAVRFFISRRTVRAILKEEGTYRG